jgi:hypothetical protein
MRALIAGAVFFAAVSAAAAETPGNCARNFVGSWQVRTLSTGQTYSANILSNGVTTADCPMCNSGTWTCNGDQITVRVNGLTVHHTLAPDRRTMAGDCCTLVRLGSAPPANKDASSKCGSNADDADKREAARLAQTNMLAGKSAADLASSESTYNNWSIAEDRFMDAARLFHQACDAENEKIAIANARKIKAIYSNLPPRGVRNTAQNRKTQMSRDGLRCSLLLKQIENLQQLDARQDISEVRAAAKREGCY